jgi:hypothetical protein
LRDDRAVERDGAFDGGLAAKRFDPRMGLLFATGARAA